LHAAANPLKPELPVSFAKHISQAALAGAWLIALSLATAAEGDPPVPLESVRVSDLVVVSAGSNFLTFNETIVVTPIKRKPDHERPDPVNLVHLLLTPLWIKEGENYRLAFPVMKPTLNMTHGRVRRVALVRPDGEPVSSVTEATPECRYAFTVEFGHVIPARFTVNVFHSTNAGLPLGADLAFIASGDGQAVRSGPPESFYTTLRVKGDPPLNPWQVVQDGQKLARVDSSSVRLEREKRIVIRFRAESE
jgi:hypothetical protein